MRHSEFSSSDKASGEAGSFRDPAREPGVLIGLVLLLVAMLPVWPLEGSLWGLPLWALWVLGMSALMSVFVAWAILRIWKDPDDCGEA